MKRTITFLATSLLALPLVSATETVLPSEFADGFFIQNEGWVGNDPGSVIWIGADGSVVYNVERKANPDQEGMLLGNVSEYGYIYGGKYYAVSKNGIWLSVFDAGTMKLEKTFEAVAGEGRAMLGVGRDKVYVGSAQGIRVLDTEAMALADAAVEGADGNIGMMARVGNYVFAVSRDAVYVIDPNADKVLEKIVREGLEFGGVTVSKDGNVWVSAGTKMLRIDPVSLDAESVDLPNRLVSPWSAWMTDKVCASYAENALFYGYGDSSWTNSETKIGKLLITDDGQLKEDTSFGFTMPAAADPQQRQMCYGTLRVDPVSGCLVVTTTQTGYGANYSTNWVHFVDAKTGAVEKTVDLKSDAGTGHYWFMSMPVMPDNAEPQIELDDALAFAGPDAQTFSLADVVSDADNLAVLATVEAETDAADVVSVSSDGLNLTFTPVGNGTANISLTVNSNGRIAEKTVTATVSGTSSANHALADAVSVCPSVVKDVVRVAGAQFGRVAVYSMAGAAVLVQDLGESAVLDLSGLEGGVYFVKIETAVGAKTEKIVKL